MSSMLKRSTIPFSIKYDQFSAYVPFEKGSGDQIGDIVTWYLKPTRRENGSRLVPVVQDPHSALLAQSVIQARRRQEQVEMGKIEAEISQFLTLLDQGMSDKLVDDLFGWLLETGPTFDRVINRAKEDVGDFIESAFAVTNLDNPDTRQVTNRLVGASLSLSERLEQIEKVIKAAARRDLGIHAQLMREALIARSLEEFIRGHELILEVDRPKLDEICRRVRLKPLTQLVSYIYQQLEVGGGVITDPEVITTLREAFVFHRMSVALQKPVRPIAALTIAEAKANPELYRRQRSKMEKIAGYLRRLKIGGAYDNLTGDMAKILEQIIEAMDAVDAAQVIRLSKCYIHHLIYRSSEQNPAPDEWYGYRPPDPHANDDPFAGLPR